MDFGSFIENINSINQPTNIDLIWKTLEGTCKKRQLLPNSKYVLLLVHIYYYVMKVVSSSPYAPFNSKEWNSLVSKNDKFENTPIKIQKKFYRNFSLKKIKKVELSEEKNELHQQMQLVFG